MSASEIPRSNASSALIVTSVMPIKTESGIVAFSIIALVWGVTFLVMGLQIMRQDMNGSTASIASTEEQSSAE